MVTTQQRAGSDLDGGREPSEAGRGHAVDLVREADGLISEVLKTGRWPQARTVTRFLQGDRLERVLALYGGAMRLDPDEPAYPWNLASTLHRLGLDQLALAFIERAMQVAERLGDREWSGAGARLACAEIAIGAGHLDTGLVALAHAKRLAGDDPEIGRQIGRMLETARAASGRDPVASLRDELALLSA